MYAGMIYSAEECIHTDKLIKAIQEEMTKPKPSRSIYDLNDNKIALENLFAQQLCSDKIETLRQNESAVLVTKQAIEQEKAVLKPANTEQRIYIVGGALVLMVGLLILAKK